MFQSKQSGYNFHLTINYPPHTLTGGQHWQHINNSVHMLLKEKIIYSCEQTCFCLPHSSTSLIYIEQKSLSLGTFNCKSCVLNAISLSADPECWFLPGANQTLRYSGRSHDATVVKTVAQAIKVYVFFFISYNISMDITGCNHNYFWWVGDSCWYTV